MGKIDDLKSRQGEISLRLAEIDNEYAGQPLPEELQTEFAGLIDERKTNKLTIDEVEWRTEQVRLAAGNDDATERAGQFHTRRPNAATGDDIYDLSTIRASLADPQMQKRELVDRAMRSVEAADFPSLEVLPSRRGGKRGLPNHEDVQAHVERLIRTTREAVPGDVARHILNTGSPLYRRAFGKTLAGQPTNNDEQRALALGAGATGGFSVVYTLDPTIVPTSNFSINPFRAISRIETIAGTNEWKALTSGAITAAYAAEATQASDNAPTLAQPDLVVDKAQAFVPFSIELGQDWSSLEADMAALLQDAKDDLEATKFALGAGHGSNEPKGLITAATATTTTGTVAGFAIADLYKVFEALPPRFRPRAQWLGNLFTFDKVRQFDTAGGSGVWVDADGVANVRGLGPGVGGEGIGGNPVVMQPALLGRAAWESTAMGSVLTTGTKILAIGDFRYFVIVDRIGMNIEILPNLVGANQRPTGQRGLYAYWRNQSDVLSTSAFQVLVTQ
jgi:HK97 family phage major capsid protein